MSIGQPLSTSPKQSNRADDDSAGRSLPETRLLIAILKTARNDWRQLLSEATGEDFCDRSHQICCEANYFCTGTDELVSFFHSEWFDTICEHIDKSPEEARRKLTDPWPLD